MGIQTQLKAFVIPEERALGKCLVKITGHLHTQLKEPKSIV